MEEVDQDKDGQISLDEFRNSMTNFFRRNVKERMQAGMKNKVMGMLQRMKTEEN